MGNGFQDVKQVINNNRALIKDLLKANNLKEIAVPKVKFEVPDEDWDYIPHYFVKVSLENDKLIYHYECNRYTNKIYRGWYYDYSMCEYLEEENEMLKYIYETLKK